MPLTSPLRRRSIGVSNKHLGDVLAHHLAAPHYGWPVGADRGADHWPVPPWASRISPATRAMRTAISGMSPVLRGRKPQTFGEVSRAAHTRHLSSRVTWAGRAQSSSEVQNPRAGGPIPTRRPTQAGETRPCSMPACGAGGTSGCTWRFRAWSLSGVIPLRQELCLLGQVILTTECRRC